MSTVKKVALKLAQENPEFRRALLEEISKEAASKEKKKTKAVRRAFNALADASFDLKAAQRSADLKGDAQFAKLVKQVETLTQDMMKHLNQHYLWD